MRPLPFLLIFDGSEETRSRRRSSKIARAAGSLATFKSAFTFAGLRGEIKRRISPVMTVYTDTA
jgi:hypothetical protein